MFTELWKFEFFLKLAFCQIFDQKLANLGMMRARGVCLRPESGGTNGSGAFLVQENWPT